MRNKLMWFYQEVDEPESVAQQDQPKPGPSRAGGTSNPSKTPQGETVYLSNSSKSRLVKCLKFRDKTTKMNLVQRNFWFLIIHKLKHKKR